MKLPLLITLMALTVTFVSRAQDFKDVPPPTPPFVAPVPDNADWTITVQYNPPRPPQPPPAPGAPPRFDHTITQVHWTKSGDVERLATTFGDGRTTESWLNEGVTLMTRPDGKVLLYPPDPSIISSKNPNPDSVPLFPGVTWVKLDYYDKPVSLDGVICYHYKSDDLEAWIDIKTLLPVRYMFVQDVYTYKFNPPPGTPLTLPENFQEAWDKIHKKQ